MPHLAILLPRGINRNGRWIDEAWDGGVMERQCPYGCGRGAYIVGLPKSTVAQEIRGAGATSALYALGSNRRSFITVLAQCRQCSTITVPGSVATHTIV